MSEPLSYQTRPSPEEARSLGASELREQFDGLLPVDHSKPSDPWLAYRDKLGETLEKLHDLGGFSEDEYGELLRLLGKD